MTNGLAISERNQVIEPSLKSFPPRCLADVHDACALNPLVPDEFRQATRVFLLEGSAGALLQKFRHAIGISLNQVDSWILGDCGAASFMESTYAHRLREAIQRYSIDAR